MRKIWKIVSFPFRVLLWPFRIAWRWISSVWARFRMVFMEEPDDIPVTDTFAKAVGNPSLLLPHLVALRRHVFRAVVALFLATILAFIFAERILDFLASPVGGIKALQSVGVTENVSVFMRVSLLAGFTVSLPYLMLETLLFIGPGLRPAERRTGCMAVPIVSLLFAGGMAFALFVALEPALAFLTSFMGIPTLIRPAEYFPFVTRMLFWTGMVFEIPIVIYFITALGFVRAEVLLQSARYVIVGLAVLAAVITPTTDPINMMIILIPLIVLYFIGVGLAFLAQRARDRRLERAGI